MVVFAASGGMLTGSFRGEFMARGISTTEAP